MPLVDRATNVLELLLAEPRLAQGDIAFVVHSFGGLIFQQALRVATDRSATEPRVRIFSRISRVTFLGTPQRGAVLATWAGVLRLIIRPSSAATLAATSRDEEVARRAVCAGFPVPRWCASVRLTMAHGHRGRLRSAHRVHQRQDVHRLRR